MKCEVNYDFSDFSFGDEINAFLDLVEKHAVAHVVSLLKKEETLLDLRAIDHDTFFQDLFRGVVPCLFERADVEFEAAYSADEDFNVDEMRINCFPDCSDDENIFIRFSLSGAVQNFIEWNAGGDGEALRRLSDHFLELSRRLRMASSN